MYCDMCLHSAQRTSHKPSTSKFQYTVIYVLMQSNILIFLALTKPTEESYSWETDSRLSRKYVTRPSYQHFHVS
jgi:hypothetical protein